MLCAVYASALCLHRIATNFCRWLAPALVSLPAMRSTLTPRTVKFQEDVGPAKAHFPLAAPFNTRMVAFGLPELSVPSGYLGPRRDVWGSQSRPQHTHTQQISPQALDAALQAHLNDSDPADVAAMAMITRYDLSYQLLGGSSSGVKRGSAMHRACLVWKSPARRQAMRSLILRGCLLGDGDVGVLARWVSQAPSRLAPLRLEHLDLCGNAVWAHGLARLVEAFAANPHASVKRLEANNCHVGAIRSTTTSAAAAAAAAAAAGAGSENESSGAASAAASDDVPATPRSFRATSPPASPPASLPSAASAAAASAAALCFGPLVPFLSSGGHCALEVLSLSQCSLGDVFVAYLAEGLRNNQTLLELHLDTNSISDAGAKLLARALGGRRAEEEAAEAALIAAQQAAEDEARSAPTSARPSARANSRSSSNGAAAAAAKGATAPQRAGSNTTSNSNANANAAAAPSSSNSIIANMKRLSFSPQQQQQQQLHRTLGGAVEHDDLPSSSSALQSLSPTLPCFAASSSSSSFSSSSCNSSLRVLSLASNMVGAVGCMHLLSMVRLHPALVALDLSDQRCGSQLEANRARQIYADNILPATRHNERRNLRQTKMAFLVGLHPRPGACAAGMRVLVEGAQAIAAAAAAADSAATAAAAADSAATAAAAVAARAPSSSSNSRPSSRLTFIPTLPLDSVQQKARPASASPLSTAPPPSAATLLLRSALEEVWEFIGTAP